LAHAAACPAAGASYALCEVLLDQFLVTVKNRNRNRHFLHQTDEERPVGGQHGAEPEQFAAGAMKLVQAGFDDRHQLRLPGEEGAGPLPRRVSSQPARRGPEIVRRTRDAVPPQIPVTVKMRAESMTRTKATSGSSRFSMAHSPRAPMRSPSTAAP
jgi:hypothetical protein